MHKSMLSKTAAAGIAAVLMVGGLGASGQGPAVSGPEVYAQEAQEAQETQVKKGRKRLYSERHPSMIRPSSRQGIHTMCSVLIWPPPNRRI